MVSTLQRHRSWSRSLAGLACAGVVIAAGGVGDRAAAATTYPGVIAIAAELPLTLTFPEQLPADLDFGTTFQLVSNVCVTAQFDGDLLDPGEGFELVLPAGGGVGQHHNGGDPWPSLTLCTGTNSTEINARFLDGAEAVELSVEPNFPEHTHASARIVSLSVSLVGVAASDDCTVVGTPGADRLTGTEGDDVICGLAGDDVISGLGGSDTILGGDGKDTIFGGSGRDLVDGGAHGDVIHGGADNDVLVGGTGWDQVYGDDGNDMIRTGDDRDLANGGAGRDWIELGSGENQVAFGGPDDDVLLGGDGPDRLYGGDGDDSLVGQAGTDQLYGGAGDDSLFGHGGRDWFCGQAGDDSYGDLTGEDAFCRYDRADI